LHNLLDNLIEVLKSDERLVIDGKLAKNKIVEFALAMDETLLSKLLGSAPIKKQFFVDIDGVLVFDKVAFQNFVSNKEFLPDSYTAFKNKIGLTVNNEFLSESNEVVLSWPYKDCILEGGQTKEDQKRKEIFWNTTLASEEIDRLMEPKVLTNFKRYNKSEECEVGKIGTSENLIIKGNNLLTLASLQVAYQGKIDLIYIDPPYNKGGNADSFQYNNTFKTSTWLTFMKNRLDEAKKLLRPDGAIIVAIDESEGLNLGVLINEVFSGYESHCITIVHNPGGKQGTNFSYTNEFAFFIFPAGMKIIGNRKLDDDEIKLEHLRNWGSESERSDAKNCFYPIIINHKGDIVDFGDIADDNFHPNQTEKLDGKYYVYPIDNHGVERKWRYARQSIDEIKHLLVAEKNGESFQIKFRKDYGQYKTVWTGRKYDASTHGTKLVKKLVPDCKFSFPKSLWNVYDCISAVVAKNHNAIVLDYHAGSGTTAHAVLELNKDGGNRKFILCEQMDYIQDVTVERVRAVLRENKIDNSFIYCELAEHNQKIIKQIESSKTSKDLIAIWHAIEKMDFISYKINPETINENINEFETLSLEEQKQFLIEILDKNLLYVNYSEIDDEDYHISEQDKKLNKIFYSDA